jgi:hypothetical protein
MIRHNFSEPSTPMQVTALLSVVAFALALMALKLFNSLRTMQVQMGVGVVLSR